MNKPTIMIAVALLAAGTAQGQNTPSPASAVPAATGPFSVKSTLVGTLLDNPATAEILKKIIPTVYANDMFRQSGRDLTLNDIQQYEPDALSNAVLAKIQVELNNLPPTSK